MDTSKAFAMGEANRGKELKVFDWDLAVKIIKDNNIKNATAGLATDMEYTSDAILKDGKPCEDIFAYLSSTWATPILLDNDTYEEYDCFIMEGETEYDSDTVWPDSALKLLNKGE